MERLWAHFIECFGAEIADFRAGAGPCLIDSCPMIVIGVDVAATSLSRVRLVGSHTR
jgi:hypothetical protein